MMNLSTQQVADIIRALEIGDEFQAHDRYSDLAKAIREHTPENAEAFGAISFRPKGEAGAVGPLVGLFTPDAQPVAPVIAQPPSKRSDAESLALFVSDLAQLSNDWHAAAADLCAGPSDVRTCVGMAISDLLPILGPMAGIVRKMEARLAAVEADALATARTQSAMMNGGIDTL